MIVYMISDNRSAGAFLVRFFQKLTISYETNPLTLFFSAHSLRPVKNELQ